MKIRKCPTCGVYTLKAKCGVCGAATAVAKPAKFSPEDPYGTYRRLMKKEMQNEGPHKEDCS